jgi:hypothetical protein
LEGLFCRQYIPDSTIPLRTGNAGRCGLLFYARSIALVLIISAGCTGTPLRQIKLWTDYFLVQDLILGKKKDHSLIVCSYVVILEGLAMEEVGIFHEHFVYFTAIRHIL